MQDRNNSCLTILPRKITIFKNTKVILPSMPKKCIICEGPAVFSIRGTNDFYCFECATENFADISVLEKLEAPQQ